MLPITTKEHTMQMLVITNDASTMHKESDEALEIVSNMAGLLEETDIPELKSINHTYLSENKVLHKFDFDISNVSYKDTLFVYVENCPLTSDFNRTFSNLDENSDKQAATNRLASAFSERYFDSSLDVKPDRFFSTHDEKVIVLFIEETKDKLFDKIDKQYFTLH